MTGFLDPSQLAALARLTLDNPRAAAGLLLRDMPPREALWPAFGLVVVLTVMLGEVGWLILGGRDTPVIALAAMQAGAFLAMVYAVHYVGRACGGTGGFDGALILVTWLQFVFLFVQIAQIVAFVLLPALGVLVALFSMGLFFWLLVNFITELHGFASLARVLMGTLATAFVLYLAVLAVFIITGLEPPGLGTGNTGAGNDL